MEKFGSRIQDKHPGSVTLSKTLDRRKRFLHEQSSTRASLWRSRLCCPDQWSPPHTRGSAHPWSWWSWESPEKYWKITYRADILWGSTVGTVFKYYAKRGRYHINTMYGKNEYSTSVGQWSGSVTFVHIWILGSIPKTNGSGSGSCSFGQSRSRGKLKIFFS